MNATHSLEQAISACHDVLANVSPDQMATPSPCESWDVAGLIDHIVGAQSFFADGLTGATASSAADGSEPPKASTGEYLSLFDQASGQTLSAFGADGALEKMYELPFGTMPGSAFMGLAITDTLQHAWDLAKATGQPTDLAPELSAAVLQQSRQAIQDAMRGADGQSPFGPEKQAPAGASAADQLAAFLGRDV